MAGDGLAESPFISAQELRRAQRRIREPEWQPAADRVRAAADRALRGTRALPTFDCSWFDADPERSYAQTYAQWHDYIRPATRLAGAVSALVRAGMVFGDDSPLEHAKTWTLYLADNLRFHVKHHDAGMDYGRVGEPMAEAYSVLRDRLTADEQERLHRQLANCGAAVWEATRHWLANLAHMPYNNHFAAHRRSLLCLGLVLDREDWIRDALNGPRSFGELLVGATLDDGLCYESSTTYHFATLGALTQTAELVRHAPQLGRDLYHETFANGRCLKQMFDAPLGLLLPTGELPALGDCYADRRPLWERRAGGYEKAYAVYGDPRYAWLLQRAGRRDGAEAVLFGVDRLETAEAPRVRSRIWVEHGYALVASDGSGGYWDGDAMVAMLTGDRSGIHYHRDTLSLQIGAGGRVWTEDAESRPVRGHAFSAPIQREFNRTMLAHNLVIVDEQDQTCLDRPLPVAEFRALPACSTVAMADLEARLAPGVRMVRSVAVTADYCLDVFQVASETEHRYDWVVHPRCEGAVECPPHLSPVALPDHPPYSVLRDAASAAIEHAEVELSWSQGGARLLLDLAGFGSDGAPLAGELIRAEWPVASDWSDGGRPMLMLRVLGRCVAFVALYQLGGRGRRWRASAPERVCNGASDEVHVAVSDGLETRLHVVQGL